MLFLDVTQLDNVPNVPRQYRCVPFVECWFYFSCQHQKEHAAVIVDDPACAAPMAVIQVYVLYSKWAVVTVDIRPYQPSWTLSLNRKIRGVRLDEIHLCPWFGIGCTQCLGRLKWQWNASALAFAALALAFFAALAFADASATVAGNKTRLEPSYGEEHDEVSVTLGTTLSQESGWCRFRQWCSFIAMPFRLAFIPTKKI